MSIIWRCADRLALLLVLGYIGLTIGAARGNLAGQPLDPTWSRVQSSGELRVAIDLGFAPFSWVVDDVVIGYDADLARAVAAQLGVRAGFVPTGFDSLYDVLGRGEADLIASALPYAPAQGWRARFSEFYFNAGQVLLVPQGSTLARSEARLDGLRVGALLGSDGDTLLRRLEREGVRLERRSEYDDLPPLLHDLRSGALDAAVLDNAAALSATNDSPGLLIAQALTLDPYVLAVPPNAYLLQAEVNRALDALERSGCLAALNQRWLTAEMPLDDKLPAVCLSQGNRQAD